MKKNKKGTVAATPMPYMEKEVSMTNNQAHSNTDSFICLMLFVTFLIVFLYGNFIDNEPLTYFGLGIGVAVSIITMTKNIKEED